MENSVSDNLEAQADAIFKELNISNRQEAAKVLAALSIEEFGTWFYGKVSLQLGELDTKFRKKVFTYIEQHRGKPFEPGESRKEILESNPVYSAVMNSGLNIIYKKMDELVAYPEFVEKMQAHRQLLKDKQREKDLHISVDGVNYRATDIIPVMWQGWELDDKAWLVEVDGKFKIAASSHGDLSWVDASFLEDKLKEYEQVVAATKAALEKLKS